MIKNFSKWENSNSKEKSLDRIRCNIDEAIDSLDYDKLDRLSDQLKESLDKESSLLKIKSFNNFNKIEENVNQAKQYFLKKKKQAYVDRMNSKYDPNNLEDGSVDLPIDIDSEEIDPANTDDRKPFTLDDLKMTKEREDMMLNSPDLNFILNLVKDAPNYATAFVKFKIDQGASNQILETIFGFLRDQKIKSFLKDLPLGSIDAYAKIQNSEGGTPGYERLIDDIGDIEQAREGFWIIDAFVTKAGIRDTMGNIIPGKQGINQKKLFKMAPQEIKDKLIKLAGDMNRSDTTGKLIRSFTRKMSNYETLEIMIEGLTDSIESIGTKKGEISASHHDDYPGTSVIWENNDKMLVIYRSPISLGTQCKHTTWCLKPRGYGAGAAGMFYDYAKGGRIQFGMWDFSVSQSDPMSLVGFTVSADGSVSSAHSKDDVSITGKVGNNLSKILDYYKVPNYSKNHILNSISIESDTMVAVEPIYKQIQNGNGIQTVISKIIKDTEKRSNKSQFEGKKDTVSVFTNRLISSEIQKSSDIDSIRDTAWRALTDPIKGGLSNLESARIFNLIFTDSEYMNSSKIEELISINNDKKNRANKMLTLASDNTIENNPILIYAAKNKQNIEGIINKATILVNSINKANTYLESLKK